MGKVVINSCYGGFGLSVEGVEAYARHKGIKLYMWQDPRYRSSMFNSHWFTEPVPEGGPRDKTWRSHFYPSQHIERDDPALVAAVEELGSASWGPCSRLEVVDLEPGTLYRITEYDGYESIETHDDAYWKVAK